jgi:hypothetical protein
MRTNLTFVTAVVFALSAVFRMSVASADKAPRCESSPLEKLLTICEPTTNGMLNCTPVRAPGDYARIVDRAGNITLTPLVQEPRDFTPFLVDSINAWVGGAIDDYLTCTTLPTGERRCVDSGGGSLCEPRQVCPALSPCPLKCCTCTPTPKGYDCECRPCGLNGKPLPSP